MARVLNATLPVSRFVVVARVALVVCLAVAVTSYLLPHPVAAILSGVGGAGTTLALPVGTWLRRSARSAGVVTT